MRLLIAVLSLTFSFSAFAMKYSDLTADQRETVEGRLRQFVPAYRIAMEVAVYNLRASIPKSTKSTDVLSKVKVENYDSVDALFEQITKVYGAAGTEVVAKARGEQRLMDLAREIDMTEQVMWAIYRRPVEDRFLRDAFLDSVMEVENLQPLTIRLQLFKRQGCDFTVNETGSACN
jgi:hypothetical protein